MKKHSVELSGHRTSIALEEEFWQELKKIAKNKNTSVRQLLIQIDDNHQGNLSSAIRLFILHEGQINQKTNSQ
ncbi:MAG: ribbon-helix-helix domain-containing protein [Alphaproteobacteria bacterium]|nr:ribbon-helix-helix domain-containing protein [Alphaproteobacteria bacterium]